MLLDSHSIHIAKTVDVAVDVGVVVELVNVVDDGIVAVVAVFEIVAVVVAVVELVVLRPQLCFVVVVVVVVVVAGIEDVGEFEEEEGLDDAEDRSHVCLGYSEIFGIDVDVVDDVDGMVAVGSVVVVGDDGHDNGCLLYTSPSPRDQRGSRMPSSA